MRAFLINLDRSGDRLDYMRGQFVKLGMDVERVPAVNGAILPAGLGDQFDGSPLSPGEIGCYASHLVICKIIVEQGLPYALVLEDDATLSPCFAELCETALWHTPQDWDCVHLGTIYKHSVQYVGAMDRTHAMVRFLRQPAKTTAYLISQKGAVKWLAPRPRLLPADVDNRRSWRGRNVYGVFPAIARQNPAFGSLIQIGRRRRHRDGIPAWRLAAAVGVGPYLKAKGADFWNAALKRIDGQRRIAVLR